MEGTQSPCILSLKSRAYLYHWKIMSHKSDLQIGSFAQQWILIFFYLRSRRSRAASRYCSGRVNYDVCMSLNELINTMQFVCKCFLFYFTGPWLFINRLR